LVPDPELQQPAADVHVAAGAGVMLADADLLPGDAHHAVAGHPAGDPVIAGALVDGGQHRRGLGRGAGRSVLPGWSMFSAWCGRTVL
jgi:hypothetical protein